MLKDKKEFDKFTKMWITLLFILGVLIGFNIKANYGWGGTFLAIAMLIIGFLIGNMGNDKNTERC